jgi:hypothetical protein
MSDSLRSPDIPETLPDRQPKFHHSAEFDQIYAAFIDAQAEFTPVAKNKTATVYSAKTGKSYTYKFADLADVLGMALPVLTRHKIGLMQPHLMVSGRLRVVTRLIHASGQWMMNDGLDMVEAQARQDFGGDSSYNRRYDVCSFLGIVADEDTDVQHQGMDSDKASVRQPKPVTPAQALAQTSAQTSAQNGSDSAAGNSRGNASASDRKGSPAAEELLGARAALVNKLKELAPGPELGKRAGAMFPQHKSTRTLTVADLEQLHAVLLREKLDNQKREQEKLDREKRDQEKLESAKPEPAAAKPEQPKPGQADVVRDAGDEVAEMFDDAMKKPQTPTAGETIGKGLGHRLHKLIGIHKIHTEQELKDDYLTPYGVEHVSDLPRDLYERLCAWAEGTLEEGKSIGDA